MPLQVRRRDADSQTDDMGHIVFASPPIARFRLLGRLRRELIRRGHRTRLLAADTTEATFWRNQVGEVEIAPVLGERAELRDMVEAIADRHALDRRGRTRLARHAAGLARWLEHDPPDLLLFHGTRRPANAVLQQLARRSGTAALWTGDGLLPGTMQIDGHGLDGDASCRRCTARDFRVVTPDRALLDAALAHALAAPSPFELPAPEVAVPPLRERLADALQHLRGGELRAAAAALHAWRSALPPTTSDAAFAGHDPRSAALGPSFAVLLQAPDDEALRLDADDPPSHELLLQRASDAVRALDPGARLAVIADDRTRDRLRKRRSDPPHTVYVPAAATPTWLATAAAAITVNHRLAGLALACGTPVVNLGRGLFDVAGITTGSTVDRLPADLVRAVGRDRPALRRRVLTWMLRHGHVWCAADQPNHNGMLGLVQAVEHRLVGRDTPRPLPYRPGPTWPLATS